MIAPAKFKTWKTRSGYSIIRILHSRSNVFLLTDGISNILIDTCVPRKWPLLKNRLKELNIEHINYLILTHTHFDHAGNAARVREKYGASIILQKEEVSCLTSGENIIPGGTMMFSKVIVKLLSAQYKKRRKYQPCPCDIPVDRVFNLTGLGFNAYIMHTPGHTPGSVSVIIEDEIAVVGDTLFGILKHSVFPPFAQDVRLMIKSWGKLLKTGCSVFIPSHGPEKSRQDFLKDYDKKEDATG